MNESKVRTTLTEASNCAMVMLESASYIRQEIPNVRLDNSLLASTKHVCSELIGTKHDIVTEVFELEELLDSHASDSVVRLRLERIMRWLGEQVAQVHELVTTLKSAAEREATFGLAYFLVAESAANILNAFHRTRAAADEL